MLASPMPRLDHGTLYERYHTERGMAHEQCCGSVCQCFTYGAIVVSSWRYYKAFRRVARLGPSCIDNLFGHRSLVRLVDVFRYCRLCAEAAKMGAQDREHLVTNLVALDVGYVHCGIAARTNATALGSMVVRLHDFGWHHPVRVSFDSMLATVHSSSSVSQLYSLP